MEGEYTFSWDHDDFDNLTIILIVQSILFIILHVVYLSLWIKVSMPRKLS